VLDQIALGIIDDVEDFRAIASVMGLGRGAIADPRVLIEPPKHLGGLDSMVEQIAADQSIGLLPKSNF
jgi:hypothetical protein